MSKLAGFLQWGHRLSAVETPSGHSIIASAHAMRGFSNYSLVTDTIRSKGVSVEVLNLAVVQLLPDLWEDTRDMIILATALELEARHGQGSVTVVSSDQNIPNTSALRSAKPGQWLSGQTSSSQSCLESKG